MSQLEASSISIGKTGQFALDWDIFVLNVLDVTVQGYQSMREQFLVKLEFEEDQFTMNLEDCIRPLAYEMGIWIAPQQPLYTAEMKKGNKSATEAKKLDLKLWGTTWKNYHQIHFVWECKRIATKDDQNFKSLVYEYVTDGMIRFLHEEWKYAGDVDDAGILGYVLAGDVSGIVNNINQTMLATPRSHKSSKSRSSSKQVSLSSYAFTASDHLEEAKPIDTFIDVYQSCHHRPFCGRDIHLYHLFLTFDFEQGI